MKFNKLCILGLISLSSCVSDPSSPTKENVAAISYNYIFALCEGLWGQDNSKLARINLDDGVLTDNFFSSQNSSLALGNTANDIVARGDTAYIAVTRTNTIEAIRLSDGKSLGRIILADNSLPRRIAIVNDSVAYCTLLYKHSIVKFNPKTLTASSTYIYSGAYPEGIAYCEGKIFVANSGYGALGQSVARASSITVFDANTGAELRNFPTNTNPVELKANEKTGKVYCSFYHVRDSIKGYLQEFDASSYQLNRSWGIENTGLCLSTTSDSLIFVNSAGLYLLESREVSAIPKLIIANTENSDKNQNWYSCGISYKDNSYIIGNAKNYTINGEILRYDKNSLIIKSKVNCGINPGKILTN